MILKRAPVLADEWKLIESIKKDTSSRADILLDRIDKRRILDKKLSWFFMNGPVSVFYVIYAIYGKSGLGVFQNFINEYIIGTEDGEKFIPSKNLQREIESILKLPTPDLNSYLNSWSYHLK